MSVLTELALRTLRPKLVATMVVIYTLAPPNIGFSPNYVDVVNNSAPIVPTHILTMRFHDAKRQACSF